jgi:hypothetical protein
MLIGHALKVRTSWQIRGAAAIAIMWLAVLFVGVCVLSVL